MAKCIITAEMVKNIIEKRRRGIHKGDCGRDLIIAGSKGMMGAAVLTSRSALRSGAGLVQLAVPEELFPIAQVAVVEATCLNRDSLSSMDLGKYDVVCVGPGLGQSGESIGVVKELIESYQGRLVLDADGLNIVAKENLLEVLKNRGGETIITPHMFEAKRLLDAAGIAGEKLADNEFVDDFDFRSSRYEERLRIAKALVKATKAVVVLKGSGTLVTDEEGTSYINTTGNPGMATAGSGDVLAGLITGLWGQKNSCGEYKSARSVATAGVYIHGFAGDLAAADIGEYGMIASDITKMIPSALKKLSE